ncbi:MAG: inorganic diphosphatase [Myxococcota bacterium]|nr:inorganic diphosphatase [Myxococcota bacterium]
MGDHHVVKTVMANLANIPTRDKEGNLRAVVETPRASCAKIKFDEELKTFVFSRPLVLGVTYPYDWGFFPSTRAADGDPLDVMIYHDATTFPGVVIPCKAIGVVRLSQKSKKGRERNDRIIAVPVDEPRYNDARNLQRRVRNELEQFFLTVVCFEGKGVRVEGWEGPKAAEKLIGEAQHTFDAGARSA